MVERLRAGAGRRTLGLGLALLIEALLLLALLTLGPGERPGVEEGRSTAITFRTEAVSEDEAEPQSREPEQKAETQQQTERPEPEQPQPVQPAEPAPAPPIPAIVRTPYQLPPSIPRANVRPPAAAAFGPSDNRPAAMRDTERVGTAPNGEPLYAAEWYREPDDEMMRQYLSTSRGPGWGLIACRTAPDYRVEDCVALSEYPEGSLINRSVLAAAWEFRVRPPRLGGRPLVGSWVRIRIEYDLRRN